MVAHLSLAINLRLSLGLIVSANQNAARHFFRGRLDRFASHGAFSLPAFGVASPPVLGGSFLSASVSWSISIRRFMFP